MLKKSLTIRNTSDTYPNAVISINGQINILEKNETVEFRVYIHKDIDESNANYNPVDSFMVEIRNSVYIDENGTPQAITDYNDYFGEAILQEEGKSPRTQGYKWLKEKCALRGYGYDLTDASDV